MVKAKQALEGKTGAKTAGEKLPAPGGAQEQPKNLRKAADGLMMANCREITDHLLRGTMAGDSQCARLLLELAKPRGAGEDEEKRQTWSIAAALAAEPEWVGEPDDEEEASGGLRQAAA